MRASDLTLPTERKSRSRRITILGFSFETQAMRVVLLAYGMTRLLIFFIIFFSSATIPMRPGPLLYSNPNNILLDGLVRDDSWWYTNIITRGYSMGSVK